MSRLPIVGVIAISFTACGGSHPPEPAMRSEDIGQGAPEEQAHGAARPNEFQIHDSEDAEQAHGEHPSQIEATDTSTAMRLFVVTPDAGPIAGIVIKMTAASGEAYYTEETDSLGYAEVLVPAGQRYDMEYLSLGRRNTTASVDVPNRPNQDLRLTMRYRRIEEPRLVLDGVLFQTNRAIIQRESFLRLDRVVEYMRRKPRARIRVTGHTDNVGNPRRNRTLSEERARAVRVYLVSHGIDENRIETAGYGGEQPVASNDTEEGRAQNRRIEVNEL